MEDLLVRKPDEAKYPYNKTRVPPNKRAPIFEPGYYDREGGLTFVRNPSLDDLKAIYALTLAYIGPDVAPFELLRSVYSYNPISVWGLYRSHERRRDSAHLIGYSSYLPLNDMGYAALLDGTLDRRAPNLEFLAPEGVEPAALYMWAIVAPRMADLAGALIAHAMGLELYDSLPLYASISTKAGLRSLQKSRRSPLADTARIGTFFEVKGSEDDRERLFALEIEAGARKGWSTLTGPSPKQAMRE